MESTGLPGLVRTKVLSTYSLSGMSSGDRMLRKTDTIPALMEITVPWKMPKVHN